MSHPSLARVTPRAWPSLRVANLAELAVVGGVIVVASLQVAARSLDPNMVAMAGVSNVVNGTGGDLSQYRVLSAYLALGVQHVLQANLPPFHELRIGQCLVLFGLAYWYYAELGLSSRTRLLGIGLLTGLMSLNLGDLGPSSFSMDRFNDTIFYLVAVLLVLRGHELWIPPLMVLAVANRETSVFIPMLIVARYPVRSWFSSDPRVRRSLLIALAAWLVAAVVYFAIHTYYGPRPRTEDSYWGPAMLLHSLSMPAQTTYFFAAINLLPLLALLLIGDVDAYLRRLFWLVVPVWFAIHIWAARLGEGIMYLAPTVVIIVPLILQGLERRVRDSAATEPG